MKPGVAVLDRLPTGPMDFIRATLSLYEQAAREAVAALFRAPIALAGLVVVQVVLLAAAVLFSPLGLAGGFIVGLLAAGCVGSYLYMVELALEKRPMGWEVIRESAGHYLWDVISVLFIFWMGELALQMLQINERLITVLWLVVFVLFNPVPEMIYQSQHRSMGLLGEAYRWSTENGPEWFGPQIALGLVIYLLAPGMVLPFLQAFGPRFGFVEGGMVVQMALAGGLNPFALVLAAVLGVVIHMVMLFRGALYKALGSSSRRARAWKQRL